MRIVLVLIVFLFILFSCNHRQGQDLIERSAPRPEVKGYVVHPDSLAAPAVIQSGKPKIIKAGLPRKTYVLKTAFPLETDNKVKARSPEICSPGSFGFSLPISIPVQVNSIAAGNPQVIVADKAHIMENSMENFSSYGKLQGLVTNTVSGITQDDLGNIWFGTLGGISRYDGHAFAHYSNKEGLPNDAVLSVFHDRSDNLWIGTQYGGVSKFDGKTFINFSEKEGMLSNTVMDVMEDKEGNIWFATPNGATKYDGKSFTHFTKKEGLADNYVHSFCQDKDGNIWFATEGGASRYDGQAFSNYTSEQGLGNNIIIRIYQDKDGCLWFAMDSGISKFDGEYFSNYGKKEGVTDNSVYSILQDFNGNLWFGSWGDGLFKYDGKLMTQYTENDGLINDEINSIFQDREGIIWFGTRAGGAIKYSGDIFHHYTSRSGMSNNQVQKIIQDRKGNIWCGTWGRGVAKYDGESFTWYTRKEGLINDDVRSIVEDRNGNIWLCTWMGVTKFDGSSFTQYTEEQGLCNNFVISSLEDSEGNLWFGTESSGVSRFDGNSFVNFGMKEGLSDIMVRSIMQDKKGNIWFATNRGVTKYEPSSTPGELTGTFTHYTESDGLPDNKVISLLEDRLGNVWFGTFGSGLIKFDGKYFTNYTTKDGLCENGVMSLLEDEQGTLWIGTRQGVSQVTPGSLEQSAEDFKKGPGQKEIVFRNYHYEDGFFGIGCNANAICEDASGLIWIGANDRLTSLNPDAIINDTTPPNVQIIGIELFNEPISWSAFEKNEDTNLVLSNGVTISHVDFDDLSKWYNIPENLSLSFGDNFLTFYFIGIATNSPTDIRYKYRLEGLDENWSTTTRQNNASYGNLPDGKYAFRFEAMSKEGNWSEQGVYNFTIRPPFWKTTWAYLFYFLAFILAILLADRIQTQRVIARERERTKDRELELAGKVKRAYEKLHAEHEIVEKQKDELEVQKSLSDELLRNILPGEVAEELKAKGFIEAKLIDEVTVLFTDFKGFTLFSENLTPQELVAEIHECFSEFDRIVHKHGIEKIKTIGDSYMAAGGLPIPNQTHPIDVVNAAIDIQQFMFELKQKRAAAGKPFLEVRIGINTGPVVAGIVGVKKFAYDIWGDTVNTASHMEKSGEVGRINISGATYQLVKDKFNCEHRGKIPAKNKGMVDMYFVNC